MTTAVRTPPSSPAPAAGPPPDRRAIRRINLASMAGTTIEYYDYFIYGTAAALVFPKLFFPGASDYQVLECLHHELQTLIASIKWRVHRTIAIATNLKYWQSEFCELARFASGTDACGYLHVHGEPPRESA